MKFMTFNLRFDCAADASVGPWEKRKLEAARIVKKFEPDVLATQELLGHQVADMHALIGEEYFGYGRGRENGGGGEQTHIFMRKSRVAQLEAGYFWLSRTPDQEASKDWNAACVRMCTWVVVAPHSDRAAKTLVMNVHFDHVSDESRVESAKLLLAKSRDLSLWFQCRATVLLGDFNCNSAPSSAAYRVLTGSVFRDVFTEIATEKPPRIATFHEWRGPRPSDERIDWCLLAGFIKAKTSTIITEKQGEFWASDHFPIIVETSM